MSNGAYDLEGVIWHQHSNKLMVKLLELWPDKNVPIVDLGCGHNFYCSVFDAVGYDAVGIDFVKLKGVDDVADLTATADEFYNPNYLKRKSNVLSLEVGEHIPYNLSDNYLNNITRYSRDIVMSWAVPGQAGVGHINCQTNEWVAEQMAKRGYKHVAEKTKELREAVNGCHCTWFLNTLMYFTPNNIL